MIYLDNCATTRMRQEVLETVYNSMKDDFANPSSLHKLGFNSEQKIKDARKTISEYLGVDEREIYFTSGGTESNNIGVQSIVKSLSKRGNHIITSKIEHASILNIMKHLETEGFRVTYLDVDRFGMIDLEELKNSIDNDTILVSMIFVNNEIGTIQDIKKIKEIIESKNPRVLLHVDGIQAFGKIDFSIKELDIDSFSFSSHKIHGPKGVGGLYIRKDLKLMPITFGGNQEEGIRSGTENVSGIIGFGKAVQLMAQNKEKEKNHVLNLKKYTTKLIEENIKDIRINSHLKDNFSPYILNISFRDTKGEVLLHFLEQKNIFISTSSACSSHSMGKSDVLKAITLDDNLIDGTIRICFSYENTKEDIDYFVDNLKESVKEIRKIMKR